MKKKTVVLDFLRFSVPNKIAFGRTVLSQMSVLPSFDKPDVAYATATDIVNKLEGYYVVSRIGCYQRGYAAFYRCHYESSALKQEKEVPTNKEICQGFFLGLSSRNIKRTA